MMVGFAFKVAAVPFHMWTPDVYQGARRRSPALWRPSPRPALSPPCSASFFSSFGVVGPTGGPSSTAGRALAGPRRGRRPAPARREADAGLLVDQPRRLYPARGGGGHRPGPPPSLYYLFAYMFMVIGSFAIVTVLAGTGTPYHDHRLLPRAGRPPARAGLAFAVLLLGPGRERRSPPGWAKLQVVSRPSVDARRRPSPSSPW